MTFETSKNAVPDGENPCTVTSMIAHALLQNIKKVALWLVALVLSFGAPLHVAAQVIDFEMTPNVDPTTPGLQITTDYPRTTFSVIDPAFAPIPSETPFIVRVESETPWAFAGVKDVVYNWPAAQPECYRDSNNNASADNVPAPSDANTIKCAFLSFDRTTFTTPERMLLISFDSFASSVSADLLDIDANEVWRVRFYSESNPNSGSSVIGTIYLCTNDKPVSHVVCDNGPGSAGNGRATSFDFSANEVGSLVIDLLNEKDGSQWNDNGPWMILDNLDVTFVDDIDLRLSKSASPKTVHPTGYVNFNFDISINHGAFGPKGTIILRDTFPPGFRIDKSTLPKQWTQQNKVGWNCNRKVGKTPSGVREEKLTCRYRGNQTHDDSNPIPPLPAISAKAPKGVGVFENCASVEVKLKSGAGDAEPADNQSCDTVEVVAPPPAGPCALHVNSSTSTPSVVKGDPYSFKIEVMNEGGQACETARIINYFGSVQPFGQVAWLENTPLMLLFSPAMAPHWEWTNSGFPVGSNVSGGPGVPTGDLYRKPNKPVKPGDPPLVFDAVSVGSALEGALNCTIAVTNISDYDDARDQLSVLAQTNMPANLSSSFGNDIWADSINTQLEIAGFDNVSCAGINVD